MLVLESSPGSSLEQTVGNPVRPRSGDPIKWAERILAVLLTATAMFLIVARGTHAGGLWRDESAVVQLAGMPSFAEISRNFQHEAFPLLVPATVRGYTNVFGASDVALRFFGASVALLVIGALWLCSRLTCKSVPLVSLALLGLNTTFLIWGTTIRGYGLGSLFVILSFGLMAAMLVQPSPTRIAGAALMSVAAVQCLLHDVVLIGVLAICAATMSLLRKNPKQAAAFLGILALCMLSFLPYFASYSSGSAWSSIVKSPTTPQLLWRQFNFALGNPNPGLAWFWHVAIVLLIVTSAWRLIAVRSNEPDPARNIALFGSLIVIGAVIGYYEFLQLLSYLARPWYFLALLSLLAVVLDHLAASLAKSTWLRVGRLLFALTALVVLPFNAWPQIIQRQTNIDIVSRKVAALATPADLIVLTPWQYGITFNRYYRGTTPWMTLPVIDDHRVHRYDLFQAKMNSTHPIADVLEAIRRTLVSGHRVWFVGGIRLPAEGRQPRSLPPASNGSFGLDNVAYSEAWQEQLGAFVRTHTERGETVPLADIGPVNEFENVPLIMVEGWYD